LIRVANALIPMPNHDLWSPIPALNAARHQPAHALMEKDLKRKVRACLKALPNSYRRGHRAKVRRTLSSSKFPTLEGETGAAIAYLLGGLNGLQTALGLGSKRSRLTSA